MHLKYKNDWDFLNDNSLEGPFDNLAEQIQKKWIRNFNNTFNSINFDYFHKKI